ncbi:hypothetical protein [Streptomyces swartbergensis]|nr:hypothetical protein [Streptomyces swartbergensis]
MDTWRGTAANLRTLPFLDVTAAVAQAFGPQVAGFIAQVAGAQRRKAP